MFSCSLSDFIMQSAHTNDKQEGHVEGVFSRMFGIHAFKCITALFSYMPIDENLDADYLVISHFSHSHFMF